MTKTKKFEKEETAINTQVSLWILILVAVIGVIGMVLMFILGGLHRKKIAEAAIGSAEKEANKIISDAIAAAEAKKKEIELEAEAEAERLRRKAKGEADAIYAKMEAEARGMEEILKKQAAGFAEIVQSAGGDSNAALKLLIADKLEELMKVQVEAIKNIKIDKITVWDSGQNADGQNSTAGFISGMMKSVPPLEEVFALAGMQLPEILGKKLPDETPATETSASVDESASDETPAQSE